MRKRSVTFFLAVLLLAGLVFQAIPSVAQTTDYNYSAYNFEYENLLLDVGDGTHPLIASDADYTTGAGRNDGKASTSGAVLDPELFSGKDELTFSFWTKFSSSAAGVPYANAQALIEKLQPLTSSSEYTQTSLSVLSDKLQSLKDLVSSSASSSAIVSAMEDVTKAGNSLVKIYSVSAATQVYTEASALDLSVYTSSTVDAFNSALSALDAAIGSSASDLSEKVATLLSAEDSLEYSDYSLQAKAELKKFKTRLADIDSAVYTESSYKNLTEAITALEKEDSSAEDVLRAKVSAVNSAFSALKAASGKGTVLFLAKDSKQEKYIEISQSGPAVKVSAFLGSAFNISHAVPTSDFAMITVSLKAKSGNISVSLYVNGTEVEKQTVSGELSAFSCSSAEFPSSVTVDDIYISSKEITASDARNLYQKSLEEFLKLTEPDWVKPSDRINIDPVDNFKWSAYTFDNGLKIDSDLNGVAACYYNAAKLVPIETDGYDGSYGMGLVRRNGIYPNYYISLKSGLLHTASAFTVSGFVRNIGSSGTSASFFEFTGKNGKLVYSPFSSSGAFFEYTDASGNTKREKVTTGNINSKWVHYAFTFASDGTVTVYVDGKTSSTFSTGINLTDLSLSSFKLISGITSGEGARLIIDDIYVSSKVMSDSDIRKLAHYGAERFVGEVLPDPETGKTESGNEEVDLSADETDALEDEYSDTSAINGYIGTTFDDVSFMGEDFNGSVFATVRNASLVQGLYKYGLNLNGKTSYLRYPKDILNSVSELTVSIAYNWITPSSINDRNQKLFAFAKKDSSVSDPSSYIYLDMGNGTDGMTLCLSDGTESAEIPISINSVGEWKRLTVTVKNGHVKVYSDTDLVAEKKTGVNLSEISPNFNYVGKSCYKGDPLFCGVVDEIYISDKEISVDEIENLMNGIAPASENEASAEKSGDVWDGILIGTLIFMGLLFAAFIAFIIYTLFFKK